MNINALTLATLLCIHHILSIEIMYSIIGIGFGEGFGNFSVYVAICMYIYDICCVGVMYTQVNKMLVYIYILFNACTLIYLLHLIL